MKYQKQTWSLLDKTFISMIWFIRLIIPSSLSTLSECVVLRKNTYKNKYTKNKYLFVAVSMSFKSGKIQRNSSYERQLGNNQTYIIN